MAPRLIVLGWDSATFDVVDPLLAEGRLPVLKGLLESGSRAPLRSTWPPMTDSAWTSAFTGCNPGKHGIFGSWYRAPGEYACRYFSSRDRKAPALWEMTEDVRHLVWNVPMTFPPSEVNGVMVGGYGAPPGSRFTEPASFQDELASRWPIDDVLDRAPHGSLDAFRDDLIRGLDVQGEALPWAARESGADLVCAVWPHVDRAQHFFWQFRGTDHHLAGTVDDVYAAMDRATGKVVEAFPDADVIIVSDHGAGTLKGDVNVGAWLAHQGRARYGGGSGGSRIADAAWGLPPSLRKLGRRLAPGLARKAMGAKLAGQLGSFDWATTDAFMGFHSDLWLNLEGREPLGRIPADRADEVLDELTAGLLEITDPSTGEPVFAGAHRRDEVYSGAAAGLAPDVILDPWSQGYRVAPAREEGAVVVSPEPLAGVDVAWSSDHRPVGIFVAAGPRIAGPRKPGAAPTELNLFDVCPTALALLEQPVPDDLDGRAAEDVFASEFLETHPVRVVGGAGTREAGGEYSADEAEAVAAHLKDLGYIE